MNSASEFFREYDVDSGGRRAAVFVSVQEQMVLFERVLARKLLLRRPHQPEHFPIHCRIERHDGRPPGVQLSERIVGEVLRMRVTVDAKGLLDDEAFGEKDFDELSSERREGWVQRELRIKN